MNTAAEAIRALSMQMPGFRRQMNEGWYQIRIRGEDTAPEAVYARLECKELFLCHDKNINSEREDVPFFSGRKDLSS